MPSDTRLAGMSVLVRRRLAGIVLVDPRGWILVQERDEHAPVSPLLWGLVGGGAEDGESLEQAAYRELAEETGLYPPAGTLRLWFQGMLPVDGGAGVNQWSVWVAPTTITDADITLGEGLQIVFRPPSSVEPGEGGLPYARVARDLLTRFLASDTYRDLVAEARRLPS